MSEFLNIIISIGKKLRMNLLFDVYDKIDYYEFSRAVHLKRMQTKRFFNIQFRYK